LRAHLWAVDRNIVKNYLTDVTESVNAFLATLKSQGAILQSDARTEIYKPPRRM
jgi:phage tail sheath protein FI